MNQVIRQFVERIGEPSEKAAYDTWVTLDDATELLREDLGHDDIALYCSVRAYFFMESLHHQTPLHLQTLPI